MLFFLISFLLVFVSSYFITSLIPEKDFRLKILYWALVTMSQVIISFEILSLFTAITPFYTLLTNGIFFVSTTCLWLKKGKPVFKPEQPLFNIEKLKWALNADKSLHWGFIGFMFSSSVLIFLAIFTSNSTGDVMGYHLPRVAAWIQNHSLNHFETTTVRQIVFPINQHILYMWSMMFIKNDLLTQLVELFSLFGSYFILWSFLSDLKLTFRRKLWSILVLASFPITIIQSISLQGQVFIGFLLFVSFYTFFKAYKENRITPAVFSALSCAIAIGSKSTAFFFMPIFAIVFGVIAFKENNFNKKRLKLLSAFCVSFLVSFVLLSSYNYILNYIQFASPFGPEYFSRAHSAVGGWKTIYSNIVRNSFLLIDFSGVPAVFLSKYWLMARTFLLNIFHANNALVAVDSTDMNYTINDNLTGLGIVGLFILVPVCLKQGLAKVWNAKGRNLYLSLTGLILPLFIITLSALMSYWVYSVRFFVTVLILVSPVLVFTYKKSFSWVKLFITVMMLYNFTFITTMFTGRPLLYDLLLYSKLKSVSAVRSYMLTHCLEGHKEIEFDAIIQYIKENIPKGAKIGVFNSENDNYLFYSELKDSYNIKFINYEKYLKKPNSYDNFDYLIMVNEFQCITLFDNNNIEFPYEINRKNHYVKYYQDQILKSGIYIYLTMAEIPTDDKNTVYIKKYYFNYYLFNQKYKLMKILKGEKDFKFYIYKNKKLRDG